MILLWFLLTLLRVYWIKQMASVPSLLIKNTSIWLPHPQLSHHPHLIILSYAMEQMSATQVVTWINRLY